MDKKVKKYGKTQEEMDFDETDDVNYDDDTLSEYGDVDDVDDIDDLEDY